ncbi:thiol:disulfide interchange protein DsbA/DsbL [Candidatus Sororendozoicomonas aggregata]|uniref:thiol:disulfide interchange protein DsbA/DsbL n=1 Tax=Candidatus Sororendozoicomonas aggregata TaxID=3073239 RepID=UPI002ED42736
MLKMVRCLWLLLLCPLVVNAEAAKTENIIKPSAVVHNSASFKEGTHYRVLDKPVPTQVTDGKIEVAEVFWYGCPHCYTLESVVSAWKPTLREDTQFIRVPAFFGPNIWKTHAQLYYTLKNMGVLEKVHGAIFDEVQNKRNYLENPKEMARFLSKRFGINKATFEKNYNAIGVTHQLLRASSAIRGYGLAGVPAIVIDGKYVVEPAMAGSLENMTKVSDFLISKVRAEKAKAAVPKVKS